MQVTLVLFIVCYNESIFNVYLCRKYGWLFWKLAGTSDLYGQHIAIMRAHFWHLKFLWTKGTVAETSFLNGMVFHSYDTR